MTAPKANAGLDNRGLGGYNLKRKGREEINSDAGGITERKPTGCKVSPHKDRKGRLGAGGEEPHAFPALKEVKAAGQLSCNLGGTTGVFLALVPIGTGAFLFFQSPRFDPAAFPEQIIYHQ